MPVSSVIVRKSETANSDDLSSELASLDGATLKHVEGDSFAVLIDVPTQSEEKVLWNTLETIEGVTHVDLIYHNFEDVNE